MKEPVPSEMPPQDRPQNIHERIQAVNDRLQVNDGVDTAHIYTVYDALMELDETTGLVDKDIMFSGCGVFVTFDDGEPSEPQLFEVEKLVGTSLGFDVWSDDEDEVGKVYLSLRTGPVEYNDDGEQVSGSIYFLDPFNSTIDVVESSFDNIVAELDDIDDTTDNETLIDKLIDQISRYDRMVRSAKFKKLDEEAKARATEKLLARLNAHIGTLGAAVSVEGEKTYLRDLKDNETTPRVHTASSIIRGEPAAFVSLRSVMPEFCSDYKHDQLCLAVAPDADTTAEVNADKQQIVFVPVKKGTEIIMESVLDYERTE